MIHEVFLPLDREAIAAIINEDTVVAELMGWSTPDTFRDELPDLISDRVDGHLPARTGDLVLSLTLSDDDFTQIQALGCGVHFAVKERAFTSLMRSVVAFFDEVDDANVEADYADDIDTAAWTAR